MGHKKFGCINGVAVLSGQGQISLLLQQQPENRYRVQYCNQRVPKANLWIIYYIMNLQLVYRYILSLSKNDNVLRKKKQKQNNTKGQKKNISLSKSRTPDLRRLRATRYLLRHDITSVENWRQINHL